VTSTGAEAELAYAGDDGTLASFGYATATARDARTDARLTNSPRHLVRLRASRPFRGQGLIPALELQWESERLTRSGGSSGDRFLVSATVSGRLSPRLGYGAGVTNLLDRRYGDPGAEYHTQETIPQRGGNYWITLRWFLGQPR
jgi:outer membrane receptor for ferric coprogen and ferric-rhodotorulic acid